MSLFDPGPLTHAPEPPEQLSAGRKLTLKNRRMLDAGIHPVSGRPLRASGGLCGDCANHIIQTPGDRGFHKCKLNITGGPATDIRVSWPACDKYERAL